MGFHPTDFRTTSAFTATGMCLWSGLSLHDSAWETLRKTPAQTVAGVLAKLRGSYLDYEIEAMRDGGEPDDALERQWVAAIYRDLERLAGEVRS